MTQLTGERPLVGKTPDSLLALHAAGYREVRARLGSGLVVDFGCGTGEESVGFTGPGRQVVGTDYDLQAASSARQAHAAMGLRVIASDACACAVGTGLAGWACSSHLIEHFADPEPHVAELARVLSPEGTAFVITPNAPADFENPFHLYPFTKTSLASMLSRYFGSVWVGGLEASGAVKLDLDRRRRKGRRLLALDVLNLRHRIPRSWYVAAYEKLLPLAYRLVARSDVGGSTGFSADDFFVTNEVGDSTLVLFAIAGRPLRAGRRGGLAGPGGEAD